MNYKFFIIVFVNICILENSALETFITDEINKHALNKSFLLNDMGIKMENEKLLIKREILLEMINNNSLSLTTNLKSNIFDKMLSEELLSIKQHFYEKDSSHTPSVQITVKGNVATPTLEVNQKWPFANLFSKSFIADNKSKLPQEEKGRNNFTSNHVSNKSFCVDHNCGDMRNSEMKDKVLGLRSLSRNSAVKICGCMKTIPGSTCSQLCTGNDIARQNDICSHSPIGLEMHKECTRTTKTIFTLPSYSVYPMYVTYPYFWELSTYTVNPYHHPNPISKIKIYKTRRRHKKKKPHKYVEDNNKEDILEDYNEKYHEGNKDNSLEVYYDEEINRESTILPDVVNNFEDDKNRQNDLYLINKDSFVNDIVEDLKKDYSDVVIKDCYCSISARNYILSIFLVLSSFISCFNFLAPVFFILL